MCSGPAFSRGARFDSKIIGMERFMKLFKRFLASLLCLSATACGVKEYSLESPDGRTRVTVTSGERLEYSVVHNGEEIISPSAVSLEFVTDGKILGRNAGAMKVRCRLVEENVPTMFYRQAEISGKCNEAVLSFDGWSLEVRAYDSGVAWRFVTDGCFDTDSVAVRDETIEFNLPSDRMVWLSYSVGKDPYANAFQNAYTHQKISEFGTVSPLAMLPVAIECDNGVKAVICESDLKSYPGMFLVGSEEGFKGEFARLPDSCYIHPSRCQKKIASRKEIIAETQAKRTYPWRIVVISENDTELPVNDLVYLLAEPHGGDNDSWHWVKPGLCAWEWWNDWGLTDVEFKPGINTKTYFAYIDFAARLGLPYVVIDEGWSAKDDIMTLREGLDFDLPGIVEYAASRGVGIFIWAVANVLDDKLEEAAAYYSGIGVKGFKVDFFDRDDQEGVDMVYRITEALARHRLMVDLHGIYKPTGLNRTFPNAVNFEGVYGLEEVKWASPKSVEYDVTFPFLRQIQGPSDYTQGSYRNATEESFRIDWHNPMSKGTRAHQVAAYVVFDSPLAMLCDSPSLYMTDIPCTEFMAALPTVFDRTEILAGELGSFIVTAREKNGVWYIGALTDWNDRQVEVTLDFLEEGCEYSIRSLEDTPESWVTPESHVISDRTAVKGDLLTIPLAPGGGASYVIQPKQ